MILMACYAVIRVRGRTGIRPDIVKTMDLLNLTRINHCVLVKGTPQFKGMLQVCKDYVTWGEVEGTVVSKLISKRGRLEGDKRLTEQALKETGYSSFDALAEAVCKGEATLKKAGIKPVLRLSPPRGGHKNIKSAYPVGALGYRGPHIGLLLARMM